MNVTFSESNESFDLNMEKAATGMNVDFGEIQTIGSGGTGKDGLSAYEIAVKNGFVGSEKEWLASLEGEPGRDGSDGEPGKDGTPGENGKSAYQYAQEGGYTGTEADFYGDLSSVGSGGGSTDLTGYATEVWVQEGYQPKGDYLTDSKLSTAINSALAQAKESGEFDGKDGVDGLPGKDGDPGLPGNDGTPGADGVTPHIGDNGNWFIGATDTGIPATGPAGADGAPGEAGQEGSDGADGVSPSVSVSAITGGNRVSITDVYGIKTFDVMDGIDGTDGSDGQDGSPGQDGVSATHSWDGTVLTITSASGTSSADLKGEPGEPGSDGQDGADGKPGADGYTPQRGKDYWTDADKAEIVNAVLNALPAAEEVAY